MTVRPAPQPAPATAADLGHPIRYPLHVADVWRTTCTCHYWWLIDNEQASEAAK